MHYMVFGVDGTVRRESVGEEKVSVNSTDRLLRVDGAVTDVGSSRT